MRITPPSRISSSRDTVDGYQIVIPAKRNVFLLLFLGAWLGGWAMGEASAVRELASSVETQWFSVFWLVGWTIGGAGAILMWLWTAAGKEVITLSPGQLSVAPRILGIGRKREFDVMQIKNLRVSTEVSSEEAVRTRRSGWKGTIAFDYGAKTFRFGGSLDEAEASQIVSELRQRRSLSIRRANY